MRIIISLLFALLFVAACNKADKASIVINTDVQNFWEAHDQIIATQDSAIQYQLLEELFLQRGTPGLKAFMARKNYSAKTYIDAINTYPQYWKSIRANTLKSEAYAKEIEADVAKLKQVYPDLKPAKIYFTVGSMMSPGTTMDSLVLIGAELAMADSNTVSEELPDWLQHNLKPYFQSNPIDDLVLLNVHEYVHTQQGSHGYDLISQCMYEGVAEFVSVIASGKRSATPAIIYGQAHPQEVKDRFAKEMFSPHWDDWLYNNFQNEFKVRDMGYYVGYAVAEEFYNKSSNKKLAIKQLIELDYSSRDSIELFVDQTGYFSDPLFKLKQIYQEGLPKVINIKEFENGSEHVDPNTTLVTVEFSKPMNPRFRGFDFGPLGQEQVLRIDNFLGFSEDGKSFSFETKLEPNKRYQVVLTDRFRTVDGIALERYLIDIKTRN